MPGLTVCMSTVGAFGLDAGRRHVRMSTPPQPSDHAEYEEKHAEDAALMRRIASSDRTAFGTLYDRLSRPLYAMARRILNDTREAEDVVQEVFLALWEKAADFESTRGTVFAWAVTLTRNRAIDRIRKHQRRNELLRDAALSDLGYDEAVPADVSTDSESSTAVRAAITRLPEEQQHALELAFFSGLTQQEIADRLQEPLGTVKTRIRRGLLKLRDTLARRV